MKHVALNGNYLQTAGSPGRSDDTCCVMKASLLKPCLVSTYALLKLAQQIQSGNNASLADGNDCRDAREPVCSSSLNIRDRFQSKNVKMTGCTLRLYRRLKEYAFSFELL